MDWENELIRYLDAVTSTAWYHDAPPERPAEFGTVERDGGAPHDIVCDSPLLTLQCWAQTRARSAALADECAQAVMAMPASHPGVFGAEVLSVYRDPDPESGTPRHRVTARLETNR